MIRLKETGKPMKIKVNMNPRRTKPQTSRLIVRYLGHNSGNLYPPETADAFQKLGCPLKY
jgi:hypothetical protein